MQLIQNLPEEHFVNLPDATRRRMTQIFSCDLSMIRFSLTTLPLSFNAAAFSSGSTIYFAPRFYRPGHPLGDAMIAHEIAHLLQQCSLSDYAPLAGHASLLVSPELDEEANAWACLSLMDASTLEKFINRPSQAQRFQPREGNRIVQPWIMMAKDIGDDPDSYGPNHDIGHRFGERYFRPPEQQRGEPKAENFVQLTDIDDACQRVEKAYYYLFRKAPPKEVYEILRRWIGISEATGEILARRGIKEEFSKAAVDERKEKEVYAEWRYYHTYAELAWALDGERKAKQELDKENAIAGLVLEDNDILFLLKRVGDRVNQFLKTQQEEDSPVHRDIIGASGKAAPYATLHKRTTYQDVIAAIQNNKDIDNVAHLAALFHDVKDIFKSAKVIASSEQDFVLKVQSEQKDLLINPRNNRYNVSTVDEADPWTLWMREEGRPVWAAPSPTMMSMWLMTKKVGALDIENEALGYAMFALWNKVYSHYASPIHRFHETLSGAQHNNIPFAPDLDAPTNYANFKGRVATQLQASAEETQAMPSPLQTAPEAVVAQGSSSKAIEESEYAPISETKSPDTLAEAVASLLKSAPYLLPILLNDLTKVEPHELEAIGQRLAAPLPAGIKKLGGQTGFVIQQLTSFLPEFVVGAAGTMTGIALRLTKAAIGPATTIANVASWIPSTAINSAEHLAGAAPESMTAMTSSMQAPLSNIMQKAAATLPQSITDTAQWGSELIKFIATCVDQAKEQGSILPMLANTSSDLGAHELLARDGQALREIAGNQEVSIIKWDGKNPFDRTALVELKSHDAAYVRLASSSSRRTAVPFEAVTPAQVASAEKSWSDIHVNSRVPKLILGKKLSVENSPKRKR